MFNILEQVFGITIKKPNQEKELLSPVISLEPDGSLIVPYGTAEKNVTIYDFSVSGDVTEKGLIKSYRELAKDPEVSKAITEIVSEAIANDDSDVVTINFDNVEGFTTKTEEKISDELKTIINIMGFKDFPQEHFQRFYVDGRIYYHPILHSRTSEGIAKIISIDPREILKVTERDFDKVKDQYNLAKDKTYYAYRQTQMTNTKYAQFMYADVQDMVYLTEDSIAYANSGLYDENGTVLSYLHYALKIANQLKMIEDSLVIYRYARATERRVFNVDTTGVQKNKQAEYLQNIIARFKNDSTYDPKTGVITNNRKSITMLEDFWFPSGEGNKGISVQTLPGGQMLTGDLPDLHYFRKKLLSSLKVPVSRFDESGNPLFGRNSEIARDEINFQKFIEVLQKKFDFVFLKLLEVQLISKKIVTVEQWEVLKRGIDFVWKKDNLFSELKFFDVWKSRMEAYQQAEPYIGKIFSSQWAMKNLLRMNDVEIAQMRDEINQERKNLDGIDPKDFDGNQFQQTNPLATAPNVKPVIFGNDMDREEDGEEPEKE